MVAYYNQWLVHKLLAMHPNAKKVYAVVPLRDAAAYGDIAQRTGCTGRSSTKR